MHDKSVFSRVSRKDAGREIRLFFAKVLKKRLFKESSGMNALQESHLMAESEKISAAVLMFAAGMHTTSNFMRFFLKELSRSGYDEQLYQEWKTFKEQKEISSACQVDFHAMVTEFVQNSKLLHACYQEAIRLYPIIPVIKRVAKKNFILGDKYVASGDLVHLNIMAAQRDARYWGANAGSFDPTRFLGGDQKPNMFAFGLGSQSCIGRHLAESESKVMGALFSILFTPVSKEIATALRQTNQPTLGYYTGFILSTWSWLDIQTADYKLRDH